jgi:hypothetical protein
MRKNRSALIDQLVGFLKSLARSAAPINIAIDIKPAAIFANEAACFVQLMRSSAGFIPGDKLDDGAALVQFMPQHFEACPAWRKTAPALATATKS